METIILLLVRLFAGVGVFLVGVHLLTTNLEQLATGRIRDLFRRIADNKPVNLGIGAATISPLSHIPSKTRKNTKRSRKTAPLRLENRN